MELSAYKEMSEIEQRHWWFRARRKIILSVLKKLLGDKKVATALDVGCGTGGTMKDVCEFAETVEGLEYSPEAIALARQNFPALQISEGAFPEAAPTKQYDLVTLFDVLEHVKDDSAAAVAIGRLLLPGGMALITVPATPSLWSEHDVQLHHQRRYTNKGLRALFETQKDLEILNLSYYNSLLFVPIYLFRQLKNLIKAKDGQGDNFLPAAPVNTLLEAIFSFERHWLPKSVMPFGVSLMCIVKKK